MKKRKRLLGILVIGLLGGVILASVIGRIALANEWKSALEQVGTEFAEVPIEAERVWWDPINGSILIGKLRIGNPKGFFKNEHSIEVEEVLIEVDWHSFFSPKIIVEKLTITGLEIRYERARLKSNLGVLTKTFRSKAKSPNRLPERLKQKIEVKQVLADDGKIHLSATLLREGIIIILPTLDLTNLGQDDKGISIAELLGEIFRALSDDVTALSLRVQDSIKP